MNPEINRYISDSKEALLNLLEELVLIQSYSHNKPGVDKMGARIAKEMHDIGFSCEFSKSSKFGNTLIARSPGFTKERKQTLITGHMDTVFPEESGFNWYKEDGTNSYGPGVADMKGGLVVGIFAIKALIHAGLLDRHPITFIFNSDEEIGSPSSRELIAKEAKLSRLAYVLEAGGLSNEIVTGRKGNFSIDLAIKGKAGHAAFAGRNKPSAILELAHKTLEVEAMNAPDRGISANVGTIKGGIGSNTVPDLAEASLDFRFLNSADAEEIKEQINKIAQTSTVKGTCSRIEFISSRPAMPQTRQNRELYKEIETLSKKLGTPVVEELRQGVSDANIIANQGIPVIDGLGPVGGKDHSEDEFIEKASLWERSILFGHILSRL